MFPVRNVRKNPWQRYKIALIAGTTVLFMLAIVGALPGLVELRQVYFNGDTVTKAFPVTVHPQNRTIVEDPAVEAMFASHNSSVAAVFEGAGSAFDAIAAAITATPLYQYLSFNADHVVAINPGFRKEEVARAFGTGLGWDAKTTGELLQTHIGSLSVSDGGFFPDTYVIHFGASEPDVEALIENKFQNEIQSHYDSSVEDVVPISEALTIASMIERETKDKNEMRIISGIIWNRLFANMKLQIDATLQYAKTTTATKTVKNWWPKLSTVDKYIKSAYNTYQNIGLPPGPISNPSVAAVLAALNPKKTDCLFYFHDRYGDFHCSVTYEEHVKMLKKYYGQGK